MTKRIDSDALSLINRALALAGSGAQRTVLDDGNVSQILDVRPFAGRSIPPGDGGLFVLLFRHVHTGAGSLATGVDPYQRVPPATGAPGIPPFPVPVPRSFDIWLDSASLTQSDSADFGSALLELAVPAVNQGIATSNTAGTIAPLLAATPTPPLMEWSTAIAAGGVGIAVSTEGETLQPIRQRIRRGTTLTARSTAIVAGTISIDISILFNLIPVGMPQNVAY